MRIFTKLRRKVAYCRPDKIALIEPVVDPLEMVIIQRVEPFECIDGLPDAAHPVPNRPSGPNHLPDFLAVAHITDKYRHTDITYRESSGDKLDSGPDEIRHKDENEKGGHGPDP